MAIVNIDLSEYDSLRNRKKELQERVKELQEQVDGLKKNSKVIIRTFKPKDDSRYNGLRCYSVSESYVNFEDVRLKVEERMKKEVENSIAYHKEEAEKYRKKAETYEETKGKEYKELIEKANADYRAVSEKLSRVSKMHDTAFNKIHALTERVLLDLGDRFFRPTESIRLVKEIEDVSFKREI